VPGKITVIQSVNSEVQKRFSQIKVVEWYGIADTHVSLTGQISCADLESTPIAKFASERVRLQTNGTNILFS